MSTSHIQELSAATAMSNTATLSESPKASTFGPLPAQAPTDSSTLGGQEKAGDVPPIIPERHAYRTLVLCFDGTGDQFDADNSNIVELISMLRKDDQTEQMVYYQAGIGTYVYPQVATPFAARISKSLDEAIAWNLSAHVMDGYIFLMQNYKAGDKICIFGFSRGAYTARSLAGMLHKVGLLPSGNHQQVPFAYKMYTRTDEIGWEQSNVFKRAFSVDVPIEFIGVWDTVNSVGLIPKRLPFTTSNTIVKTFRHAIALDERRAKFKANLWNKPDAKELKLGTTEGQKPIYEHNSVHESVSEEHHHRMPSEKKTGNGFLKDIGKEKTSQRTMEHKYSGRAEKVTDVEEVWFSGCHCDVGGGSVTNDTPHSLARIPLRWMIRECFKTNSGIMFCADALRRCGLNPASLYPIVQKRPAPLSAEDMRILKQPSLFSFENKIAHHPLEDEKACMTEEEHELHDALSPKYDQLSIKKRWWILEIWPVKQRYQKGDKTWARYSVCNFGRGRFIPKQKSHVIKVHRSVKMRMEAMKEEGKKKGKDGAVKEVRRYRPKASFQAALDAGNVEWVD